MAREMTNVTAGDDEFYRPPELRGPGQIRKFETGATRDTDEGKPDYEGYLSPLVLEAFGRYMTKHRKQPDGSLRASDNWQKGMSFDVYIKSGFRHFMDWWGEHRGWGSREGMEDALMGLLFNVMGYAHEWLKQRRNPVVAEPGMLIPMPAPAAKEEKKCYFCGSTSYLGIAGGEGSKNCSTGIAVWHCADCCTKNNKEFVTKEVA